MKIGILGTRGIPNNYGGFEQFAQYLSEYLVNKKGHSVYVYNSHKHPYQKKNWNGVNIIHKYDPEHKVGTAGQFLYDLNCILDCRKRNFDAILQLGYTSNSVWGWLLPKKSVVITNMDGLEWKRSKYGHLVKSFLLFAEKLAVKNSDYLIADSTGIENYIKRKYGKNSYYIPYGAFPITESCQKPLDQYDVKPYYYDLVIARLQPENNIELILEGVLLSSSVRKCLVIGDHQTKYGRFLKNKFNSDRIVFLGGIYNIDVLNNLRYYSQIYFHGHSVGGTNPSLLEAMASKALICAHDNEFNRAILNDDAFYFKNTNDIIHLLNQAINKKDHSFLVNNFQKIIGIYSWDTINKQYTTFIESCTKGF